MLAELKKLTGVHVSAFEGDDGSGRADCLLEPGAIDPGELYFERSKLAAWSASATLHAEVHERKAVKREQREKDRSAIEAEYQISAVKRVLTKTRKGAEMRTQAEEQARAAAEGLVDDADRRPRPDSDEETCGADFANQCESQRFRELAKRQ